METDKVAIPTHFYKIIFPEEPNGFIENMTFLLPHTKQSIRGRERADNYLTAHFTSIDSIEILTGIDFLPGTCQTKFSKRDSDRKISGKEDVDSRLILPWFERLN